ncbi:MAG: TatD family hydrolase, partial [Candidatus Hydrogenedentota bacterium]
VHWYSGPLDVFHELVAEGTYFTIGFEVLHSEHIRTIARELPSEQLLTETDNPGGPSWLTGKPGMPLLIGDVVQALADLKKTSAEAVIQTVETNFAKLIRDDPWLRETYSGVFEGKDSGV